MSEETDNQKSLEDILKEGFVKDIIFLMLGLLAIFIAPLVLVFIFTEPYWAYFYIFYPRGWIFIVGAAYIVFFISSISGLIATLKLLRNVNQKQSNDSHYLINVREKRDKFSFRTRCSAVLAIISSFLGAPILMFWAISMI